MVRIRRIRREISRFECVVIKHVSVDEHRPIAEFYSPVLKRQVVDKVKRPSTFQNSVQRILEKRANKGDERKPKVFGHGFIVAGIH